jgi:hypothetical protein
MSGYLGQIEDSSIPYPQKRHLVLELASESGHRTHDLFAENDLRALEEIHSTRVARMLAPFSTHKIAIETTIAFAPLAAAILFISKEGKMIEFIREGGAGMYALLVVGGFLLLRELRNAFRLLVVKDHSKESLRLDTPSVLLGCLALMFFGIGWSALGIYISASAVVAANMPNELLVIGVKESLTPTILASLLSAVVILAHYGTRRALHIWRAPVTD